MRPAGWEYLRLAPFVVCVLVAVLGLVFADPAIIAIAFGGAVIGVCAVSVFAYPAVLVARQLRAPGTVVFVTATDGLGGFRSNDDDFSAVRAGGSQLVVRADAVGLRFVPARRPGSTAAIDWSEVDDISWRRVRLAGLYATDCIAISSGDEELILQPAVLGGFWLLGRSRANALLERLWTLRTSAHTTSPAGAVDD